jgi:hypothetical protein
MDLRLPAGGSSLSFTVPVPGPVRIAFGSSGFLKVEKVISIPSGRVIEVPVNLVPDPYEGKEF